MDIFLQQLINGLVRGNIYAIVALGYTMMYEILGIINFAHGDVRKVGAMVALSAINVLHNHSPGLGNIPTPRTADHRDRRVDHSATVR